MTAEQRMAEFVAELVKQMKHCKVVSEQMERENAIRYAAALGALQTLDANIQSSNQGSLSPIALTDFRAM